MVFPSEYVVAAIIAVLLVVFVLSANRNTRRRRPVRSAETMARNVRPYPKS